MIQPDIEAAQKFLELLDPERVTWTFQTFDDNQDRKSSSLARILHGRLDQHQSNLVALNKKGAGIFVCVNPTDGKGRTKENITKAHAVWIEDDDGNARLPTSPSLSVESSPGKYHHYFILKDGSKEAFSLIQNELVANWGSDPNAKDISRVLRLPGFFHQKINANKGLDGSPFLVRLMKVNQHAG